MEKKLVGVEYAPEELPPVDEMLQTITNRSAPWYVLASYLQPLQEAGISGNVIEDMSGIDRSEQNRLAVGSDVYFSLEQGGLAPEIMNELGSWEFAPLLYPFRACTQEQRLAGLNYMWNRGLTDQTAVDELARSIEDFKKREPRETEGFEYVPGDCLACKVLRDAYEETRSVQRRKGLAERAYQMAETDSGREVVQELLDQLAEETGDKPKPALQRAKLKKTVISINLSAAEISCQVIPVVGDFASCSAAALAAVEASNPKGAFGIMAGSSPGGWVSVPGYPQLNKAKQPAALAVKEVTEIENLSHNTEGPGMMLIDRRVGAVREGQEQYWLVEGPEGSPLVLPSDELEGRAPLAEVLLLCRKPSKAELDDDMQENSTEMATF